MSNGVTLAEVSIGRKTRGLLAPSGGQNYSRPHLLIVLKHIQLKFINIKKYIVQNILLS